MDTNQNGKLDKNEPGLAGMLVYTGANFVKTNQDGTFSIKITLQDKHIIVLPNAEFSPVLDQYGQPVFYQKATDSAFLFPMKKTGPNKTVLLIADPQVSNTKEIAYTEQSLKLILQKVPTPGLMVFLGDLVMDDVSLFQPLKESFARLGVPWLTLYGNHDSKRATPLQDKLLAYEQKFGPTDYAWQLANTRILCINNVLWSEGNSYTGGLSTAQKKLLSRLASFKPKPKGLLQLMHIPLQGDPKESEDTRARDREFLLNLGKRYDYEASVSGHSHIMYWSKIKRRHWHWNLGTLSGSWWSGRKTDNGLPNAMMQDGTPPGAGLFQGWPLQEQFRYVPIEDQPQLKVFMPAGFIKNSRWPYQKVLVQWLGNPESTIQYQWGERSKWQKAKQKKQFNPAYLQDYSAQFSSEKVALVYPRVSHSLYEIRLPPLTNNPRKLAIKAEYNNKNSKKETATEVNLTLR